MTLIKNDLYPAILSDVNPVIKLEKVKTAILKAYELVPEAYRQKFRSYKKFGETGPIRFIIVKLTLPVYFFN